MERKTFNVLFKREDDGVGNFAVKAVEGLAKDAPEIVWGMCPEIKGCGVSGFLSNFFDKDEDVQEFKMTLTKK